ncbi:FecCD family ABC transporter permease [Nonomuraea typhae]|uniref:FecCD family ABC transporter permease n=1 Tax=Nonomuraea typhae TaxID=2603600 RepID=UPI001FE8E737|nr:iron ABC transporter permease [Nonomuraea typhae]
MTSPTAPDGRAAPLDAPADTHADARPDTPADAHADARPDARLDATAHAREGGPPQRPRGRARHVRNLTLAVLALLLMCALSVALGSAEFSPSALADALLRREGAEGVTAIWDLRIPRTLVGLGVGAALGLAGAIMQSLTRNPLADPGILGVNAGAATGVALAFAFFGLTDLRGSVWFAFAGAAGATVLVYTLGSRGYGGATPIRLALVGTAADAALLSIVWAVLLLDSDTLHRYRFWSVGSLAAVDAATLSQIWVFLAAGALFALRLGPSLNALALGEDTARSLGVDVGRARLLAVAAVTLLCGAATAAVGPVFFLGLAVPHIVRALIGADQRWLLPYSMLLAPTLLLACDVLGRLLVRPAELEVGIITAFAGAPVLIALLRGRRKVGEL